MNNWIGRVWDWSRTPVPTYRGEVAALWACFALSIINTLIN